MPILKKQVQDKASRPEFLRDDEEVFHCQMTNEIFRDYEDFAERTILCNSMVWTCSMTGKSNQTYTEALQSEDNARRMLQDFPYELRIPLLFLASKTKRNSFKDMAEDVWSYMKDRYFVGENIEACFSDNKWKDYHVLQVMAPADDDKKLRSPPKLNGQTTDRQFYPPSSMYKYDLEQLDAEDEDISEKIMVDMSQMRRKKGIYSKDKNKLFLKQYVEQGNSGFLAIKESALESFGIHKMKFDQIFDGPLPKFGESCRKNAATVVNGKKVKQETLAKFLTKDGKQGTAKKNEELLEKMKQRELEFKRKKEELKQKATDDKEKKKLEENKIQGLIRDWYKLKDDLEVEDQRILPVPTSVQCRIPEKYLGDAFCLLEFINTFKKALKMKDIFSGGLTLELLERALMDKEVAGPLPDIVQLLLGSIFRIREEEAAQYKSHHSVSGMKVIREEEIPDEMSMAFASRAATNAWYWSRRQQGFHLAQLSLYSLTVTEILRIHLLSSGATEGEDCTRWRYQMRGGYTAADDPGLYLRLQYPHLLKSLAVQNVIELSCSDKLKILHCLMNQLLTYSVMRDLAEDSRESIKANKLKIKTLTYEKLKKSKKKLATPKDIEGTDKNTADNATNPDEIDKQIENLQKDNFISSTTLGTDRAYRRYIKLDAIPGFFVENEEDNAGICLASPTKQYPQLNGCKKAVLSKHLIALSEEMNTSDKENEPKSPSKKMLNGFSGKLDITDNARILSMCTANPSSCSIHCVKYTDTKTATLSRWTFYHNDNQLDELIRGLNMRGLRESELKLALQSYSSGIRTLVSKTPIPQISAPLAAILEKEAADANPDANGIDEEPPHQPSRPVRTSRGRRSGGSSVSKTYLSSKKQRYDNVTLGYSEDASATEVMHLAITDNILEMEEKIRGGQLGHLKLTKAFSREKWRELLTAREWDYLDSTLVHAKDLHKLMKESGSRPSTPTHPDNAPQVARKDDRYREYTDPGTFIGHNEEDDPNSSSSGDALEQLTEEHSEHSRAIRGLALALAQLGQSVEHKYLKKPLGHCDISPKACTTKDILPRWQQSLLASTSYSQLFLHYNTLDSCIMWSRSALLAWCRICRGKRDSENMLLCDACNNGHHLYCLRPKLTSVPKGDWFCDKCKREREPEQDLLPLDVIPRKKRRIFRDEDVSEEEETEDEEEWVSDQSDKNEKESTPEEMDEDDEEEEREEEEELDVVRADESSEEQNEDGDEEEDDDDVEEEIVASDVDTEAQGERVEEVDVDQLEEADEEIGEEDEDILMDECNHCKSGGDDLIQCEDCKLSYHLECVNPPLRRPPRGIWTCTECKERKECEDSDEQTSTRRSNRRDIEQRDDLPLHNASLQELLKDIMKHKDAWPFIRPVQKNEVPDYYKVIERPMDFGTIKYKLNMGEYNFDAEFMADSVLVFENCNTYNNSDAEVYKCGVRLLKHFSKKCSDMGLKTPEEMQFDDEDNQPIVSKAKKRRTK